MALSSEEREAIEQRAKAEAQFDVADLYIHRPATSATLDENKDQPPSLFTYKDFKREITSDIAKGSLYETTWAELYADLQKRVEISYDFTKYAEHCMKIAHTYQIADEKNNLNKTKTDTSKKAGGSGSSNNAGKGGQSSQGSTNNATGSTNTPARVKGKNYPLATGEELTKLISEGRCFNCHMQRHRTPKCPIKLHPDHDKRGNTNRADRIAAVVAGIEQRRANPQPSATAETAPGSGN
ncbi:hypothetical protein F4780DRAFT_779885 [Xylariomycetidae sp. FL0641]|nr:hypothetical protein F4780DRAFT_779885 [Xylariomycetidae sp. FL0641]